MMVKFFSTSLMGLLLSTPYAFATTEGDQDAHQLTGVCQTAIIKVIMKKNAPDFRGYDEKSVKLKRAGEISRGRAGTYFGSFSVEILSDDPYVLSNPSTPTYDVAFGEVQYPKHIPCKATIVSK